MSINSDHAFANGLVFSKPKFKKRNFLDSKILNWISKIDSIQNQLKIQKVWQQFEKSATISEQSLLGINAWCVNSKGDRTKIILKDRVICKGLLRIETFGDGHIIINPEVYIGDDCLLSCANRIEIGHHTLIAHGVHIFDNDTHPLDWQQRLNDWEAICNGKKELKPYIPNASITIGQYVWIGFNSTLLKGVTIGDRSVVAAGSVVTKNVPSDVLVAGNPARIIREGLEAER